jgi:hypothetical protein
MASPIAGNESFTTVENSVGQLDRLNVADVRAFDLTTQNLLIEDNARISSLKPSLEGLSAAEDANEADTPITLTGVNNIVLSDFNGAATTIVNLPAATENATVVLLFTTGNTDVNTLTINCASGEEFLAGTTLKSAGVTVVQSTAGDNRLVYTPGTTAANLVNMGTRLYFLCTNAGVWRMNSSFNCGETTAAGAFVFSTV